MSSSCLNCKTKLSCGCQKRVASNGAQVCTTCLGAYEAALKSKRTSTSASSGGSPLQANVAPSNVTVLYKGPGITK